MFKKYDMTNNDFYFIFVRNLQIYKCFPTQTLPFLAVGSWVSTMWASQNA